MSFASLASHFKPFDFIRLFFYLCALSMFDSTYANALENDENEAKQLFCTQSHFDSIFFDGQKYKFIAATHSPRRASSSQIVFSIGVDERFATRRFVNYTREIRVNNNQWLLQTGFYLDFANMYVEFCYRDALFDLRDRRLPIEDDLQRAVELELCKPKMIGDQSMQRDEATKYHDSILLHHLTRNEIASEYGSKYRFFAYDGKRRILSVVLSQHPLYHCWINLSNLAIFYASAVASTNRSFWTCEQGYDYRESNSIYDLDNENQYHHYAFIGAFSFMEQLYVVSEKVSRFGLRNPSFVSQVVDQMKFKLNPTQISLKHFFGCNRSQITEPQDADKILINFNRKMIIITAILSISFLISLFVTYLLHLENIRPPKGFAQSSAIEKTKQNEAILESNKLANNLSSTTARNRRILYSEI